MMKPILCDPFPSILEIIIRIARKMKIWRVYKNNNKK